MNQFLLKRGIVSFKSNLDNEYFLNEISTNKKINNSIFLNHSFLLDDNININNLIIEISPYIKKYFGYNTDDLLVTRKIVVQYGNNKDTKLKCHCDDSLITVNYCLRNTSTSNNLIYKGRTKLKGKMYQNIF